MPRLALRPALLVAAALASAGALAAHDTWLMPVRGAVPVGGTATLELTSAGRFPVNEIAIAPERVEVATARLAGADAPMTVGAARGGALRLTTTRLMRPGTATLTVSLAAKTLTLTPAQVTHYLDEIDADSAVRAAYRAGDGTWTETYAKHAKAYVRVGDAPRDSSWLEPIGQRLELVPQRDPVRLRAGTALRVQVLRCIVPRPQQAVTWIRAGARRGGSARADADGMVTIPLDRPGKWLVRATAIGTNEGPLTRDGCTLAADTTAPRARWRSDFATLVLEVR